MKYLLFILCLLLGGKGYTQKCPLFSVTKNYSYGAYKVEVYETAQKFSPHTIIFSYQIHKEDIKKVNLVLPVSTKDRWNIIIENVYFTQNDMLAFSTNHGTYTFPCVMILPKYNEIPKKYLKALRI
tara:strand:- start:14 stop:391 length:378 start_codon:yes stop_codon:yes gene_type:complete